MEIRVIRGGPLTTVQDAGRPGHRAEGLPAGGAADLFALRLANLLVGNPDDAAVLECTLAGPTLEFAEDTTIAIGGAEFAGVPSWQPIVVHAGGRLALGPCHRGCRGYVAIAGGIDVPVVLGSRSTHLRAHLGGHEGRALRDGDVLPAGAWVLPHAVKHWRIDPHVLPAYSADPVLRVLRGAQWDDFDAGCLAGEFAVTPVSDRMGIRLAGPTLVRRRGRELLSAAVAPGTVQVPPDGQPILLLADAQTIGGYPRLAHVIGVDLPLAAQLRPGDKVRFAEVTLEEAHRLWRQQERTLAILRQGLAEKLR
jgi:antagonist of KipI